MNRETAEHAAELAALLERAGMNRFNAGLAMPGESFAPHLSARAALALTREASKLHRIAERQCNFDIACPKCDGSGETGAGPDAKPCRSCQGTGSTLGRAMNRSRARVAEILATFGLFPAWQTDPRGWPVAIFASEADAKSWDRTGSPRELLRVTPHA